MCSWCWGMAPVVEQLEERYGLAVRVVVGGLRPGPAAQPLDDRLKVQLAHHWRRVAEVTGQPFDHRLLSWEGWIYDTELPCRAVVAARELDEARTLPFFTLLQRAFYLENRDLTSPEAYPELAEGFGLGDRFLELLEGPEIRRATWEDFRWARGSGVSGFPTLLLETDDGLEVVSRGYAPLERLDPVMAAAGYPAA